MYVSVWVCAGARVGQKRVSDLWDLELQTGSCEAPDRGAGNLAQALCRSSNCLTTERPQVIFDGSYRSVLYLTHSELTSLLQTFPRVCLSWI